MWEDIWEIWEIWDLGEIWEIWDLGEIWEWWAPCKTDYITSNFLKAIFHKFYLVHSWMLCLKYVSDNFHTLYCMLKFLDHGCKHLLLEFERWIYILHAAATTTKIQWDSCSLPDSKGSSTQLLLRSINTPK